MRSALPLLGPLLLSLFVAQGCDHGHKHDGADPHAHGDHGHGEEEGLEPVSVTAFTEKVLLFIEHPPLIKGEKARFLAHFSVLKDGEPIRSGEATLEATGLDGKVVTIKAEKPARDGLFIPEGAFDTPGTYKARVLVRSEQAEDSVDMGELVVHADKAAAEAASKSEVAEEPPGAVPFLLEQQWKVKLLLAEAKKTTLTQRIPAAAQIVTPPNAAAVVSPPVAGKLLLPEKGELPRPGDEVEAGQVLGYIEPPVGVAELAQLRTLQRETTQARSRLEFAERELARVKKLREQGLSTAQALLKAEQDVALARAEQSAAAATKGDAGSPNARGDATLRLPLLSPIKGVIVSGGRAGGEHVRAEDELFRIVNPATVWVEARVSEFELADLPKNPGATMTLPGRARKRFDLNAPGSGRLVHVGAVIDQDSRTVPVRYEIPNPDGVFKAGMLADVELETAKAQEAVAIPAEAVIVEQGLPTVYVMLEGETFQKRDVVLGIKDGGLVEVKSGVTEGERVATRGAYLIKLAAASPASFGHGHAH